MILLSVANDSRFAVSLHLVILVPGLQRLALTPTVFACQDGRCPGDCRGRRGVVSGWGGSGSLSITEGRKCCGSLEVVSCLLQS